MNILDLDVQLLLVRCNCQNCHNINNDNWYWLWIRYIDRYWSIKNLLCNQYLFKTTVACNNVTYKIFSQLSFSVTSSIVSSLYIDMPWENCIFIANFYNNYLHFCKIPHRFLETVTVPVANFRGQVKVRSTSALCKANDRVLVWFLIIQRDI